MSELGDVLEVMLSSGERFQTLQASIREWRDPALDEESRAQLRAQEGQKVPFPRGQPRPKPFETHIRLWYRPPDRYRIERELPDWLGGASTTVKIGPEWWIVHPDGEVMTNDGRASHGTGPGPDIYLDPIEVVPRMTLRAVGRATHAGRPAVHLEGHLRPYPVKVYMNNIPIAADLYDILIDAERGVLLRVEPRFKGRPIMLSEVTSIAYDNVPDDVFTFVPPPGARIHGPDEPPTVPTVSLEEAARRAPFKVFTPRRIPEGAHMSIPFDSGRRRPTMPASVSTMPASVSVQYHMFAARHHLSLQEAAARDDLPTAKDDAAERLVRDGQEMFYYVQPGNDLVYLECEGTAVTLLSDLERETLLQIADSLEAASTDPPRLTPA